MSNEKLKLVKTIEGSERLKLVKTKKEIARSKRASISKKRVPMSQVEAARTARQVMLRRILAELSDLDEISPAA